MLLYVHCKHTFELIGIILFHFLVVNINISLLFKQTCYDKKINTQNSAVESLPKFHVRTPRVFSIVNTNVFRTECFCCYKMWPFSPDKNCEMSTFLMFKQQRFIFLFVPELLLWHPLHNAGGSMFHTSHTFLIHTWYHIISNTCAQTSRKHWATTLGHHQ